MTTKTARYLVRAIALAALLIGVGCAGSSPTAPAASSAAIAPDGADLTSSSYRVTLLPDLTASPSSLSVASGYNVLFVNNSGRGVALHSYTCTEFTFMSLMKAVRKRTGV